MHALRLLTFRTCKSVYVTQLLPHPPPCLALSFTVLDPIMHSMTPHAVMACGSSPQLEFIKGPSLACCNVLPDCLLVMARSSGDAQLVCALAWQAPQCRTSWRSCGPCSTSSCHPCLAHLKSFSSGEPNSCLVHACVSDSEVTWNLMLVSS